MKIVAMGLVVGMAVAAHAQTIQVNKDNRTIAITATDTAEAPADTAELQVGFSVYGTAQDGTYAEGSRVSNAVMKALTDAGVKKEQIRSTSQQITEVNPGDKRYDKGIRFVLSQGWRVTVKAGAAAQTLDVAVKAGANESGGIEWKLADDSGLDAAAAEKALTHAQQIAEKMALGLHARLGPLVYASNQAPERGMVRPMMMANSAFRGEGPDKVQPLAISADTVSRTATVYAVFAVE
jgi:uncharacterized protein YggE